MTTKTTNKKPTAVLYTMPTKEPEPVFLYQKFLQKTAETKNKKPTEDTIMTTKTTNKKPTEDTIKTTKTTNKKSTAKLYTVPTKEEVKPTLEARVKELESELALLKTIMTETYGRPSNYKPPMNTGVGDFIRECITSGLKNVDILKLVEEKYTNNNTTYACVAWYRNDMKKKGLI